jgi:hypothetical protein
MARPRETATPVTADIAQAIADLRALLTREVLELRAELLDLGRRQREEEERVQGIVDDLAAAQRAKRQRKRARTGASPGNGADGGAPTDEDEDNAEPEPGTADPPLDDQPEPR